MDIELIPIDRIDRWNAGLEKVGGGDIYFHPGYLRPLMERGEGEPFLAHFQSGDVHFVHAVMEREIDGARDLCSPYGYAGPIGSVAGNEAATAFFGAWQKTATERGIVSEFIRFHPLIDNADRFRHLFTVIDHGQTVWIDLTADFTLGYSATCRKNLRAAQNKGVVYETGASDRRLEEFYAMYSETMQRRQALDYYFFQPSYFRALRDGLGENFVLASAKYQNKTVAYGLFLRHGPYLHYHLGASDFQLRSVCGTNLVIHETAVLGQKNGARMLHLGGAYGDQVGLFKFKAGFSKNRRTFSTGRIVYDQREYDRLTALRRSKNGVPMDENYFPAYRSPLS